MLYTILNALALAVPNLIYWIGWLQTKITGDPTYLANAWEKVAPMFESIGQWMDHFIR